MATVMRRRLLVNPARKRRRKNRARRKMSAKQIRIFGTPAQKAALKRSRKRRANPKHKAHRSRTRPAAAPRRRRRARKNVGEILTVMAAGNPARPRKRKTNMAAKRRRKNAARRRHHVVRHRRQRRATALRNPGYRVRRRRSNGRRRGARRNPGVRSMFSSTSIFAKGAYVIFGLLGTRMLTQAVLQSNNAGFVGYGGNLVAAILLGWGGRKFISKEAGTMVTIGGVAGLIARLVTDLTPIGKFVNMQLSGMDGGMGAIMPSSFLDPALFTGNGAERVVPSGLRPLPAARTGASGLGASTYRTSTYRA